jgi:hypothetical protein
MGETSREPLLNLKTRALSEQSQAHPKNEAARSAVPEVNGLYLQCSRLQGWRFGNDAMAPPIPLGGRLVTLGPFFELQHQVPVPAAGEDPPHYWSL